MLNHKVIQKTFTASTAIELDQEVNSFISTLEADLNDTYIVSPMQISIEADGTLYQPVHYSKTTPIGSLSNL